MAHLLFFFFNDTATTEIYTLSLHDALPISRSASSRRCSRRAMAISVSTRASSRTPSTSRATSLSRSEEHTSELQSLAYLVCRLLLEKKKTHNLQYSSSLYRISLDETSIYVT